MADWMLRLLKQSGVNVSSSAVGVEVCRRVKAGREMRIVINQGTKPATVKLGRRILKIKRENVVVIT